MVRICGVVVLALALNAMPASAQDWFFHDTYVVGALEDLSFPDASHGWAVGAAGQITRSTDSGAHWIAQASGTSEHLFGVHFADEVYGWAVGENGTIRFTDDGGTTWTSQTTDLSHTDRFTDIAMADSGYGWIAGYGGLILTTADSGSTWVTVVDSNASSYDFEALHVLSRDSLWLVGAEGRIWRTFDGGSTWTERQPTSQRLRSVHFATPDSGWAAGAGGVIVRTTDGGSNWSVVYSEPTESLSSVYFVDSDTGWAGGFLTLGLLKKTTDGGSTWSTHPVPRVFKPISAIQFYDKTLGWGSASGFISTVPSVPVHPLITNTVVNSVSFASGDTIDVVLDSLQQGFSLQMTVLNDPGPDGGDIANEDFSWFTFAFPDFGFDSLKNQIELGSATSSDLVLRYKEFFGAETDGGDMFADYVMVETRDADKWLVGEINDFEIDVTPTDYGYMTVEFRIAAYDRNVITRYPETGQPGPIGFPIYSATLNLIPVPDSTFHVAARVFLEGPYAEDDSMTTDLNPDHIPLSQPYADPVFDGTDLDYDGTEAVAAGFFAAHPTITDWVLLDVRDPTDPSTRLAISPAFLHRDGSVSALTGSGNVHFDTLTVQSAHLVIHHRNHLSVMSAVPGSVAPGDTLVVDFTGGSSFVQTPLKSLSDGNYGMAAAEGVRDGAVQALDFDLYLSAFVSGASSYTQADYDLNGAVQISDFNLYRENAAAGLSSDVP